MLVHLIFRLNNLSLEIKAMWLVAFSVNVSVNKGTKWRRYLGVIAEFLIKIPRIWDG